MSNDEKRPLGKILLQRKFVSQQDAAGKPVDAAGAELDALRALSEQHGVPGIDLTQVAILLEHLDVVPREVSESHRILPVLMRGDRIFLAMSDPSDKRVIDELEFVTGKKVYPYIAVPATITSTIHAAYEAKDAGEMYYLGPRVPPETLRQLGLNAPTEKQVATAPQPRGQGGQQKPPSIPPEPPRPVVDEAMERAGEEAEVSTTDFGNMGSEISSVTALPDDLRIRAGQAAADMTTGSGKLVLIVDDEADIRKMLKRLLTDKGFRTIEADRGLLALRLVKEHVPDLIVLDAMLPELHGFDIARRIKGSEKYGHIPIVMISAVYRGWRIAEDLKQSYGIEEYLEKPFRLADVVAAVNRAFAAKEKAKKGDSTHAPTPDRDPEVISAEAETALLDGIAAYKAGKLEEAIEQLKRGVHIDPLSYRLHFHLALLYGKKGMVYEGIQELERAVDLNPRHFPALKNLAVLYEKAGFKHKAVEMWERCVHGAPDAETRASIKEHMVKLL
jgi:CheY-like chemotaxis protein